MTKIILHMVQKEQKYEKGFEAVLFISCDAFNSEAESRRHEVMVRFDGKVDEGQTSSGEPEKFRSEQQRLEQIQGF